MNHEQIRTDEKCENIDSSDTDQSIDISELLNRTGIFEGPDDNFLPSSPSNLDLDVKQYFKDVINDTQREKQFFTKGKFNVPQPAIYVNKIQEYIPFPFTKSVMETLRPLCKQAPFGLRDKTVTDTSFRNSFEMHPDQFEIRSKNWNTEIFKALKQIKKKLDLTSDIQASIYKLLVYEEGSFFKTHRDTEKETNMFGTMVIVLPCDYTGGELVVQHNDITETAKFGKSTNGSHFCAFFADCYHQLMPVKSGFRIAITYNLSYIGRPVILPSKAEKSIGLKDVAQIWNEQISNDKTEESYYIHVLDHEYSKRSIKSSHFKPSDNFLTSLIDSKRFNIMVCQVDRHVHGPGEEDWGDDACLGEDREAETKITEIEGHGITTLPECIRHDLNELDKENDVPECCDGTLDIDGNFIDDGYRDKFFKGKRKYEGHQGNWAGEVEQWYHLTIVVFFPKTSTFNLYLTSKGADASSLVKAFQNHHKSNLNSDSYWRDLNRVAERLCEMSKVLPSNRYRSLVDEIATGVNENKFGELINLYNIFPLKEFCLLAEKYGKTDDIETFMGS